MPEPEVEKSNVTPARKSVSPEIVNPEDQSGSRAQPVPGRLPARASRT